MSIVLKDSGYHPLDKNFKSFFYDHYLSFYFSPNKELSINFRDDNYFNLLKAANIRKEWIEALKEDYNNEPYSRTSPHIYSDNIVDENDESFDYYELLDFYYEVKDFKGEKNEALSAYLNGFNIEEKINNIFNEEKKLRQAISKIITTDLKKEEERKEKYKPYLYTFKENEVVILEEPFFSIKGEHFSNMKNFVFDYFEKYYEKHVESKTSDSNDTKNKLLQHLSLTDSNIEEKSTIEEKLLFLYNHYKKFPRVFVF